MAESTVTKSKALVVGMLFKVDVANPNAGWTEETVTPLKKIETPDNERYPYISGQALRRYLRDTLANVVEYKEGKPIYTFSPEEPGPDPKSPILTAGRPDQYLDDDLFGFMRAVRGSTRRRESPLRVSAAFGLFPYKGDRDLGTRSALRVTSNPEAGGALFETEVTSNVFRTTWLLELDRVGVWHGYEDTSADSSALSQITALELAERRIRVKALLRAIKYLNGGARQTRLLVEFVPQMLISARLTKKLPLFLNALRVTAKDGLYSLVTGPIAEIVKDYSGDIQSLFVGLREDFVTEKQDDIVQLLTQPSLKPTVSSIGEAVDAMIKDIDSAEF